MLSLFLVDIERGCFILKKDSVLVKYTQYGTIPRIVLGGIICSLSGTMLYFLVNAAKPQTWPIWLTLALIAFGAFFIIQGVYQLVCPFADKLFKKAAQIDSIETIEEYLHNAEQNNQLVYQDKRLLITEKYFIGKDEKESFIALTENLMWAYKYTLTVNGAASHYLTVAFHGEKKARRTLFAHKRPIDKLQDCLCEIEIRLPHVMLGYSENLLRAYTKNPSDFIAQWNAYTNR